MPAIYRRVERSLSALQKDRANSTGSFVVLSAACLRARLHPPPPLARGQQQAGAEEQQRGGFGDGR